MLPPVLHATRYGSGPLPLLAFHGMGQTGHRFADWAGPLGRCYTIHALDLPFHGKTRWPLPLVLAADWQKALSVYLSENQIDAFSLVGFSLGGRLALATLMAFPEKTRQLLLLAPDGLARHPLYRLATASPPGRWLFRRLMQRPDTLLRLGDTLARRGYIHASVGRMSTYMTASEEKRLQILHSWLGFRKLTYPPQALAAAIGQHRMPVQVFMGKHDFLVPHRVYTDFAALSPLIQVTELPCGHSALPAEAARYLASHPDLRVT